MTFDLSNVLSLLSLFVALGTALAAHHYFRSSERQRDEDLMRNAITVFAQYRADVQTFERERKKTGCPIDDREEAIFNQVNQIADLVEELEHMLLGIIESGKKLSPEIRTSAVSMVALTQRFSILLQTISAKFINANNNRIAKLHELREKLPQLEALLRSHLNK